MSHFYEPKSNELIDKASNVESLLFVVPLLVQEMQGGPKSAKVGPGQRCTYEDNTPRARCACSLCQFRTKAFKLGIPVHPEPF
ncbi:MAG TPA: hypothetical protein VHX44_09485 [Planctomycetota bacterium]|jgi:hypothetical protein|nr:hypothetical protein [Planctomycetota bacterium]